jgi:electron transport complex protein RnfD
VSATPPTQVASRVRDVRTRRLSVLLALLPAVAVRLGFDGVPFLATLGLALAFAALLSVVLRLAERHPTRRGPADMTTPLTALLFALWLPSTAPWWLVPVGILATALTTQFTRDALGRPRFHAAMAGIAAAWLVYPAPFLADSPASAASFWLVLAYAAGTLWLIARRVVRWPAPLALLGVATLAQLPAVATTWSTPLLWGDSPYWLLAAGFVVADGSGCATARGRWLFGAGVAGLASIWAFANTPTSAALAASVLLMNAAAPWIDRRCEPAAWRHGPSA